MSKTTKHSARIVRCDGCGHEESHQNWLNCQNCNKTRCLECEYLEPSERNNIVVFICWECENKPVKGGSEILMTKWVGVELTQREHPKGIRLTEGAKSLGLHKAINMIRAEIRRLRLNHIPMARFPSWTRDEIFIYPLELYCFAGLFVKDLQLVLLGDASNHLKRNPKLRRVLGHKLMIPRMNLTILEVPIEARWNQCYSEAATIAISLLLKYHNKDWSPRVRISSQDMQKAKIIIGYLHKHYNCDFCKELVDTRLMGIHEKDCPANPNNPGDRNAPTPCSLM